MKRRLYLREYSKGKYTLDILNENGNPTGEQATLEGTKPLDSITSAAQTYTLTLPDRKRKKKINAMPEGSGGVRCAFCQAHAAAKGDGSPITLKHLPACPEGAKPNRAFIGVRRYLVILFWQAEQLTEELIIEAPGWDAARALIPQIAERDYDPGWSVISVSEAN
jgi:hypothetical protein